ncbi:MAG TPA: RnfH family protein [Usitatibacter sp.]|nr:RnfH family protein [Usitatibacter sp.]
MISVTVALALPDRQEVVALRLAEGSTIADALERSGLARRFPEVDLAAAPVGVWSRRCERSALLRDGDRVEVYRPLQADPKEMRRRRARLKPSP